MKTEGIWRCVNELHIFFYTHIHKHIHTIAKLQFCLISKFRHLLVAATTTWTCTHNHTHLHAYGHIECSLSNAVAPFHLYLFSMRLNVFHLSCFEHLWFSTLLWFSKQFSFVVQQNFFSKQLHSHTNIYLLLYNCLYIYMYITPVLGWSIENLNYILRETYTITTNLL